MTPLAKLLEAALFASARPVALADLKAMVNDAETTADDVVAALDELREHYDEDGHGVELVEVGGGWQILTRPEYTEAIERAQLAARPQRLSAAALETLAIIAYRQPIGRAEIEEIRGVDCGQMLKSLHERGLIDVVGAAKEWDVRCCTERRPYSSSSSRCAISKSCRAPTSWRSRCAIRMLPLRPMPSSSGPTLRNPGPDARHAAADSPMQARKADGD